MSIGKTFFLFLEGRKPDRMKRNQKKFSRFAKKNGKAFIVLCLSLLVLYFLCLPDPLFKDPICTVLEDKNEQLLGARIAADGQWRFPEIKSVPKKFERAILTFEDKRFHDHIGFDLKAIARAFRQNISAGKIVSGGSTISMQVIRLSRKGKTRTVFEKFTELILSTRLELRFSKNEILALYASHAPFGGNVVGLESASWRYFGKKPGELSWSEASMLAVLPNSPSMIHPGKNRAALKAKRNRLIKRLFENGELDQLTYELACQEPLPEKPVPLPQIAPHLLGRIHVQYKNSKTKFQSTIDKDLQLRINDITERKSRALKHNGIHNLAVLIIDVQAGEVLSYVGNAPNAGKAHGESVDIITSPRSTGSILKPLLYCQMLQSGELLPSTLIPDIPSYFNGYRPENFHNGYAGAIAADQALARSLNIPFVRMLQQYGVERFHHDLKRLGLSTITRPPDDYGLTLILGGAEGTLWDLTSVYAGYGKRLSKYYSRSGKYGQNDFAPPLFINSQKKAEDRLEEADEYPSADAIWFTLKSMEELVRPDAAGDWKRFQSSKRIAWKTGTSIGFRDAWAIGVTPEFAVGVWAGNADGEGRPGLVGVQAAAPLLFEVFESLPNTTWFSPPYDAMVQLEVCENSGTLPKSICPKDSIWAPRSGIEASTCAYHQLVHLDETSNYQVNSGCYPVNQMVSKSWFKLPALEEVYFRSRTPNYQTLPPMAPSCSTFNDSNSKPMELIYPENLSNISIPKEIDGSKGKVIFEATHSQTQAEIYWHLDQSFVKATKGLHSIEVQPEAGYHTLTLVDKKGNRLERRFRIIVR